MSKTIAIIPVKNDSERVPNKNFREFDNNQNSLLDILIAKLHDCNINNIYISSNSEKVQKYSNDCKILARDEKYCNNVTPWSDVIYNILSSIPEHEDTTVLWCHSTTPLFSSYSDALNIFNRRDKTKKDSLVVVEKLKDFIVNEYGLPVNYAYGPWHKYSQDLPNFYRIVGSLFIGKLGEMKKCRYVFTANPILFNVGAGEAIDIDTMDDFEMAQAIYNAKAEQSKP